MPGSPPSQACLSIHLGLRRRFLACGRRFLLAGLLAGLFSGCSNGAKTEMDPLEMLEQAESKVLILDFENARKLLMQARPHLAKGDPDWSRASYLLSVCSRFIQPVVPEHIEQAHSLLEELYEEAKDEELRSQAALDLGRLHELADYPGDASDLEKAREWYLKAKETATGSDMVARSQLRLAHTYAKELDEASVRQAIDILESFVRQYPESAWVSVSLQYIGDLYAFWLENTEEAVTYYDRAAQRGFALENLADRYIWRIIIWAEENNLHEQVITYARTLIENYPRSTFQTLAKTKLESAQASLESRISPES